MRSDLPDLDPGNLAEAVGPGASARGAQYACRHAVVRMHWDAHEQALFGTVRSQSASYPAARPASSADRVDELRNILIAKMVRQALPSGLPYQRRPTTEQDVRASAW